jgi:hypothetical protein
MPCASTGRRSSSTTSEAPARGQPHARVGLAAVLDRQGDHEEAAPLLTEAATGADELGMAALTTRLAGGGSYSGSSPSQ